MLEYALGENDDPTPEQKSINRLLKLYDSNMMLIYVSSGHNFCNIIIIINGLIMGISNSYMTRNVQSAKHFAQFVGYIP